MTYRVEAVADSIAMEGPRLTTVVIDGISYKTQAMLGEFEMFKISSARRRVVITATEWGELWALRNNEAADPTMRRIARLTYRAIEASSPVVVPEGEWHLPFIQPDERNGTWEHTETARRVSMGRCARGSHLDERGERDLVADEALFESLNGRTSLLGHVATPFTNAERTLRRQVAADVKQRGRGVTNDSEVTTINTLVTATAFSGSLKGWQSYGSLAWNNFYDQ